MREQRGLAHLVVLAHALRHVDRDVVTGPGLLHVGVLDLQAIHGHHDVGGPAHHVDAVPDPQRLRETDRGGADVREVVGDEANRHLAHDPLRSRGPL